MSKETIQLMESWPWDDLLQRRLLSNLLRESANSASSNLSQESEVPLSLGAMIAILTSTGLARRWTKYEETNGGVMPEELIPEIFTTLVAAGYNEHLAVGFLLCLVVQDNQGAFFNRQDLGEIAYFAALYTLSGIFFDPSHSLAEAFVDFAVAEAYPEAAHLHTVLQQAKEGAVSAKQELIDFASRGWLTSWSLQTEYGAVEPSWACKRYDFLAQKLVENTNLGELVDWALDVSIPAETMVMIAELIFVHGRPKDPNKSIKLLVKAGSQGYDSAWERLHEIAFSHNEYTSWVLEEIIKSCRELFVSEKLEDNGTPKEQAEDCRNS